MQNNLHLYPSTFTHETRILKETKSIADAKLFDKIFIAAIWRPGLAENECIDSVRHVWRVPLTTRRLNGILGKGIRYLEWMIRIYQHFKSESITCVNCHTISVLPLGILLKKRCGASVVYDAHELETEKLGLHGVIKKLCKWGEARLIPLVDGMIVVSDSIADWYRNTYYIENIIVVKNIPYQTSRVKSVNQNILKTQFNIPENALLFLYQGLLSYGRGLHLLLRAFTEQNQARHIVFMGYGQLEAEIQEWAVRYSTIHFHQAVPPDELSRYTAGADIGCCLIEDRCLSYRFSMPNKLFEYIFSGIPVIASDFPDMGRFIDEYQCGWKVPVSEQMVRDLIHTMTPDDIRTRKQQALHVRSLIGWEQEQLKLLELYRTQILGSGSIARR